MGLLAAGCIELGTTASAAATRPVRPRRTHKAATREASMHTKQNSEPFNLYRSIRSTKNAHSKHSQPHTPNPLTQDASVHLKRKEFFSADFLSTLARFSCSPAPAFSLPGPQVGLTMAREQSCKASKRRKDEVRPLRVRVRVLACSRRRRCCLRGRRSRLEPSIGPLPRLAHPQMDCDFN